MAARKLQTEIDRTLKRVKEGVEEFESLYEKMQVSQNQAQKEKMESDLKTMIKKLQRLRDQIKTWLQSNEIKDKKPLMDNRKLIETQMERFKAVEKEMKTKAFSKEGLIAAAQMNPEQRAKAEVTGWISTQVDELSRQIESAEAELEQLNSTTKKSKKGGANNKDERVSQLDNLNERRSWHISRLEILLRLVENGQVDAERVNDVKEDISYFVESNAEEDFEEDDGIYDEFNLDEEEENFGLKDTDEITSSHDSMSVADDGPRAPSKRRDSEDIGGGSAVLRALTEANKKAGAPAPKRSTSSSKGDGKDAASVVSEPKEKPIPTANFNNNKAPPASVTSPSKPAPAPATLPPIRYAAAAAAAVGGAAASNNASATPASPSAQGNAALPPIGGSAPGEDAATEDSKAVDVASNAAESSPAPQHAAISNLTNGAAASATSGVDSARGSPSLAHRSTASMSQASPSPSHASAVGPPPGMLPVSSQAQQQAPNPANAETVPPGQLAASSAAAAAVQPAGGGAGTLAQQQAAQRRQGTEGARLPSSLSDLVSSFESAKQKSLLGENNLSQVHQSLEASFKNVPEPLDTEKPKYYVPKNAYPTPPYYPQQPASIFDNPALYSKLDVDTLFYIFYYQQGTYHQFLAAKELKRQSWRFHKQYLTWFQRHSEPHAITDEYEQGVYVYFDWEGSWCQRKKSDFRFEYRWLEEN